MEIAENYQATLDYLYKFVDFSLTKQAQFSPDQFNLERMRAFCSFLGEPQQSYPIIHIAGTKGKGSTAAMCASVLQAAGYRTGLYTSPHLVDYTERIQVDRQPITQADLAALVDEIKPYLDSGTQLTTFEITTALGLLHFARQDVDAAVIEVGLGGRLDATNIVTPAVSVITSLSYDHTQFLGNTLAEIAGEKAGIIKPGIPVALGLQQPEAREVIVKIAAERGSPLVEVGRDVHFSGEASFQADGQTLSIWLDQDPGDRIASALSPVVLTLPLLGRHQLENAATAYTALELFRARALPISAEALRTGFDRVEWPARFEVLQRHPPLVIDCAHNRDSAARLRQTLDDYFPDLPVVMVFGASEDKDIEGMFIELLPRLRKVIATRSIHPRAADPNELAALARRLGCLAEAVEPVEQALAQALQESQDGALTLVTGSIFVAAAVRDNWYNPS